MTTSPPVVHNQLLGLLGVQCKTVVGTPHCQVLDLFPVAADQTYHCGAICKLDYVPFIIYCFKTACAISLFKAFSF